MKKLLLKIFFMMGISMLLVFAISRITLAILQNKSITDPIVSYHISLIAGALGLILFTGFLYLFIGKRLKSISKAVNAVANGKLDIQVSAKGNDELSQLSRDFNRMTEGLKSNEYLNREFVKNVSHEFKTPLSIILGYSDLLRENELTKKEIEEYADFIYKEANRLANLSEKLLAISKLEANDLSCSDPFLIDEQIRNILLSMQVVWLKKELKVEVDITQTEYVSNKDLCYLIWQNLISNAVKYTPEKGEIHIILRKDHNNIIFSIANTGNSLRGKEDLIFQSFYTSDESGMQKGTGLGLPLVKKVLEKLGGSIQVVCNEKTEFIANLPMDRSL